MDTENKNCEKDMMVDNNMMVVMSNMNPYYLEINNEWIREYLTCVVFVEWWYEMKNEYELIYYFEDNIEKKKISLLIFFANQN